MKKSKRILIIFVLLCISSIAFMIFAKVKASIDIPPITIEINEEVLKKCNFEVLDVRFEPIHRGKNIVHVQVRNNSKDDQTFAIQVQSYAWSLSGREGWGRNHGRIIKANTTSWGRFPFVFHKSIKNATVLLKCYGPPHDSGSDTWFKKIIYNCNELPHRNITAEELNHVSDDKAGNVIKVFKKFQSLIGDRALDEAWKLCTNDYIIGAAIDTPHYASFGPKTLYWKMENLVQLQPESVSTAGTHLYLKARYKRLVWLIDFVQVDNQWKIDWIDHKYNEYKNSPPDTFDSKREPAKPLSESQIKAVTKNGEFLVLNARDRWGQICATAECRGPSG